jgi:hypothetical protein
MNGLIHTGRVTQSEEATRMSAPAVSDPGPRPVHALRRIRMREEA